jgi:hypothetical protein
MKPTQKQINLRNARIARLVGLSDRKHLFAAQTMWMMGQFRSSRGGRLKAVNVPAMTRMGQLVDAGTPLPDAAKTVITEGLWPKHSDRSYENLVFKYLEWRTRGDDGPA